MRSSSSTMLSLVFAAAGLLELAPSALAAANANTGMQKRQPLQAVHHQPSQSHIKNRRHSKMAKKVKAKKDMSVLFSGGGLGTLYYDMNGGGTCGPINGWYSYAETGGYAMCEPNSGYKTLAERGSNRVVAIPSNMLQGNQAKYCGKEISVTYNGNTVNNLILWDGCAACNSNGGLDFSSTVFAEVFGENNCGAGKLGGMTWEILDRQIWSLDGTPVADSQPEPAPETSTWSAPAPSSTSSSSAEEETSTSSTWVTPSTTSSTSTWTPSEVSSSSKKPSPKPSKVSEAKSEEPVTVVAPTKDKPVFVAKPSSASSSQADEATPSETSTSSEEDSAAKPTSSATPEPSPSAEPAIEEPVPVSSIPAETIVDEGATTGNMCNSTPGVWQCSGNYLRQCVQTLSGWEWMNRVACAEGHLINCDSPNPVCTRYVGKRRLPLQ